MEEDKKLDTIYIRENDEISDIIERIKNINGKSVTLAVSEGAIVLQDVINLKILQKKAEELGKEISIAKLDGSDFYKTAENNVSGAKRDSDTVSSFSAIKKPVSSSNVKRFSDIVKRNETVDLRNIRSEKQIKQIEDNSDFERNTDNTASLSLEENKEKIEEFQPEKVFTAEGENETDKNNFWEVLKEEKQNNEADNSLKVEKKKLFDDHGRASEEVKEMNNLDFSYAYPKKKKKKFAVLPTISARFFASFIALCILTAALALYFILPKVDIVIAMKKEEVKGDYSFVLDEKISEINSEEGKIPVAKTEITNEKAQTFTASSKKRVTEKAVGEITILNECSTGSQVLVAGTRFASKDGKVYKIEETATIPGFTKPEADIVPGQKTAKVVAAEAGESYNIAATTFIIPAYKEKGDWRYSCLYAKSDKAMTGGLDKEVVYVSQEEYDKAVETITADAKEENKTKVAEQKNDDFIYIDDEEKDATVKVASSSAKVNDIAEKFTITVSATKSVQSIKKKDLEDILADKIAATSEFKNAKPVEGSLLYQIGDIVKKDNEISLNISASEDFTFEIDQDKIKKDIAGKNKEELNEYFSKMSGVRSVSVNPWPFWVNKVPASYDKINITLDISDSL